MPTATTTPVAVSGAGPVRTTHCKFFHFAVAVGVRLIAFTRRALKVTPVGEYASPQPMNTKSRGKPAKAEPFNVTVSEVDSTFV
ncbi:hypothetical protein D3C80_1935190 [compost metagenome]